MTRLISFYAWKDKSVGTQDDERASAIAKSHTCQPTWRSCGLGVAPSERALCMWCARMKGVTSEVDKYRADGWTDGAEGGREGASSLSLRSAPVASRREVHSFPFLPPFDGRTDGRLRQSLRHTFSSAVAAAAAASATREASGAQTLPFNDLYKISVRFHKCIFGETLHLTILGT